MWVFFVGSWILQFVGHGVFEGRKPAITDNVTLALVAPFFVTAEILFISGWNKDMFEEIEAEIKIRIEKFRSEKNKTTVTKNK